MHSFQPRLKSIIADKLVEENQARGLERWLSSLKPLQANSKDPLWITHNYL